MKCLVGELRTESPLLGDVPDRDEEVERRSRRVTRTGLRHLDKDCPPVLVHIAVDVAHLISLAGGQAAVDPLGVAVALGMGER